MDLHVAVTTLHGAVVVVDDHFAPPNFSNIDPVARTAQYNFLNDNPDRCMELAALLGITGDDKNNAELVTNTACQKAGEFWEQFNGGAYEDLLGLLLSDLRDENQRNRQYIDELIRILKAEFGVDPLTFVTLEDARESLKTCAIAFLDYLIDESIVVPKAAIEHHKTVSNELGLCFNYDSKDWPKLVFLISSKLPDPNGLELFRDQMGIKAAFFSPLDKKDIQEELLKPKLKRLTAQYPSLAQLNTYLESILAAISGAAESIANEIKRLELHDLTAVHWLRLDVDSESIQSYLSWLVSEALAVKFRGAVSQLNIALPDHDQFPLLDGKLFPRSVLFELFAEIAGGPVSADFDTLPLGLGDVLKDVQEGATPRSLLLAISPACDLARCSPEYEVLCVRGRAEEFKNDLSEVLSSSYKFYGKGRFVLKHIEDSQTGYSYITWSPKQICTIPVSALKDTDKYKRIARLSELFTQEIKDLALSHASRVGTPVDPSFCVGLNAVVRMQIKLGQGVEPIRLNDDLSAAEYIPAVLASGRIEEETEGKTVMFSMQFHERVLSEINRLLGLHANNEKLIQLRDHFLNEANLRAPINENGNASPIQNVLTIKYGPNAPEGDFGGNGMEITLYPYAN